MPVDRSSMHITSDYGILVRKEWKLQHSGFFNLSPYLKWKQPQQLPFSFSAYITEMDEGPASSDHLSISP